MSSAEPPPGQAAPVPPPGAGLFDWAKAVVLGVRDTIDDMIGEGRRGASEAYEERWQHFEAKTKKRRKRGG